MKVVVRLMAIVVFVALSAPSAFAFNVLTNPSFNGSLTGWIFGSNTVFDPTQDATGTPGSGSAKTTFTASGAATQQEIFQCVAVGPGSYTFGGKVLIPSGQAVGGSGLITVTFLSGAGCGGTSLAFQSVSTTTTGSFQTLSSPVTAPAGTLSVEFSGQNFASAAGTHVVNFDDFVLDNGVTLAGPANAPALGPLALLALLAALATAGFLVLRR